MKKLLAVLLVCVLTLTCFAGCFGPKEEKVTVSWYQGSKLLKEEEIIKGSKVTSWTPTAENKTFQGWFAEASLSQAFDFDAAINEDTDIFAAFKSEEYVEDTNEYYLIGTGAGDMVGSNWQHAAPANLKLVKQDVAGKNVYEVTITMYAGDMFQICYGSWDGQQGIGIMTGAEYCDGVNFYDNKEYTAADKKVAQVKDADGNVVFIGSDEYNKTFDVWNIKLAEGQDGKYKFTLTTYPASKQYNTLDWELVEAVEPLTKTHEMHFIGTMNNWTIDGDNYILKESDDKSSWLGFITITPDMYADWTVDQNPAGVLSAALKVKNGVSGSDYGFEGGQGNIYLTEGTYAVKYTVADNNVVFEKCDYYVVGTFKDGNGAAVNFSVKAGVTPTLTVDGTTATIENFEAVNILDMNDYSWMVEQGKPGVMAIKVVFGSELGIKDWYSDSANNGDNWYLPAGAYTISLDIATGAVTVTPVA
jgi:hypothetical protein